MRRIDLSFTLNPPLQVNPPWARVNPPKGQVPPSSEFYQNSETNPRQKNSTPFRFRGLRKSRENCISVESFFLLQIGPASLGSDLGDGIFRTSVRHIVAADFISFAATFLCFAEKTERAHAAAPPLQPEADASGWAEERNHRAFLL